MTTLDMTWGVAGSARRPAVLGTVAIVVSAVVIITVDMYTWDWPLSPATRTISEYAFGRLRWPFYAAALLLAGGSLGVLAATVRAGLSQWRDAASVAMFAWCVGLVMVVAFDKHDWTIGPSVSGYIHQLGSLSAFVAVPVAGLLLARRYRSGTDDRAQRANALWWMSAATTLWIPVLITAVMLSVATDIRWWELVPLGIVERALTASEVLVVLGIARMALIGDTDVSAARHPSKRET